MPTLILPQEGAVGKMALQLFDVRPALRSKTVITKLEDPKPSSLR
jgi:hypothetical protein